MMTRPRTATADADGRAHQSEQRGRTLSARVAKRDEPDELAVRGLGRVQPERRLRARVEGDRLAHLLRGGHMLQLRRELIESGDQRVARVL